MIFLLSFRQLLHYCLKIFLLRPFAFITLEYFAAIARVEVARPALAVTGHSQQCTDPYEYLLANFKPKSILTFNLSSLMKNTINRIYRSVFSFITVLNCYLSHPRCRHAVSIGSIQSMTTPKAWRGN
jgi:hypothetical protein